MKDLMCGTWPPQTLLRKKIWEARQLQLYITKKKKKKQGKKKTCHIHGIGIHSETKRKWMSLSIWTDDRFDVIVFSPWEIMSLRRWHPLKGQWTTIYINVHQENSKQLQILTGIQQINLASLSSGYVADSYCGMADLLHSYLTHQLNMEFPSTEEVFNSHFASLTESYAFLIT